MAAQARPLFAELVELCAKREHIIGEAEALGDTQISWLTSLRSECVPLHDVELSVRSYEGLLDRLRSGRARQGTLIAQIMARLVPIIR